MRGCDIALRLAQKWAVYKSELVEEQTERSAVALRHEFSLKMKKQICHRDKSFPLCDGDNVVAGDNAPPPPRALRKIAMMAAAADGDDLLVEMCNVGTLNAWWVRRALDSLAHHDGHDDGGVMRVMRAARFVNFVLTPVDEGDRDDFDLHLAANGCVGGGGGECPWHAWTFVVNVCVRALMASPAVAASDRRFLDERLVSLVSCGAYRAIVTILTGENDVLLTPPEHRGFVSVLLFDIDEMFVVPFDCERGHRRRSGGGSWLPWRRRRRGGGGGGDRRPNVLVVPYRAITSCTLLEFSVSVTAAAATMSGCDGGNSCGGTSLAIVAVGGCSSAMSRLRRQRSTTALRRARRCALNESMYDTLEILRSKSC